VKLVETAGNQVSGHSTIDQLTPVGNTLYFTENERGESVGPDSAWQTTGTANTLRRLGNFELPRMIVKDPTTGPAKRAYFYEPGSLDNTVKAIFSAKDGKVTVVKSGLTQTHPEVIIKQIGDDDYFSQPNAVRGTDLWYSTGGPARLVASFPNAAAITDVAAFGSKVIVSAGSPYVSDRTAAGTTLLEGPNFTDSILAGDQLFYVISLSFTTGWDLWVTDGTPAGTHITRDFPAT
jgi:ELWxxDGT repeat protein